MEKKYIYEVDEKPFDEYWGITKKAHGGYFVLTNFDASMYDYNDVSCWGFVSENDFIKYCNDYNSFALTFDDKMAIRIYMYLRRLTVGKII